MCRIFTNLLLVGLHLYSCNPCFFFVFFDRYMVRKLFAYAKGECCMENADNPMFQELLLGGHLYLMVLKVS